MTKEERELKVIEMETFLDEIAMIDAMDAMDVNGPEDEMARIRLEEEVYGPSSGPWGI